MENTTTGEVLFCFVPFLLMLLVFGAGMRSYKFPANHEEGMRRKAELNDLRWQLRMREAEDIRARLDELDRRNSQSFTAVTQEPRRFSNETILLPSMSKCPSCGSYSASDRRGNCGACGAPR